MQRREPIFNVPAAVVGVLAVLGAVHAVRSRLTEEQDEWLVLALAFIPGRYTAQGSDLPGAPWAAVTSFVTHMLLHGDVIHLLVNSAWLLAVGAVIARRAGTLRFLGLSIVCGIAGALAFLAANPGRMVPMIGASGAISGLMGAVFRLMFAVRDTRQQRLLREHPEEVPRLSVRATLRDRNAFSAIALWVVVNLLFGFGVLGFALPGTIAWEAHLGGFFAGLFTFGFFDREVLPAPPAPTLEEPPTVP